MKPPQAQELQKSLGGIGLSNSYFCNLIPCQAKLKLYKTAIMPHLTYCHLVWNSCRSSDRRKIERVQERALRAVFKSTTETYEEILERAKLPTLYNRRLRDVATLMYKVKINLVPSCVSEIFTRKDNRYHLRNSDFETPRFNTICYGKHSIYKIPRATSLVKTRQKNPRTTKSSLLQGQHT